MTLRHASVPPFIWKKAPVENVATVRAERAILVGRPNRLKIAVSS
ncbi:MAG: hypothetical protein V4472_24460 [Pseudomonadota bacterium]